MPDQNPTEQHPTNAQTDTLDLYLTQAKPDNSNQRQQADNNGNITHVFTPINRTAKEPQPNYTPDETTESNVKHSKKIEKHLG
jgi:hypothetical protein